MKTRIKFLYYVLVLLIIFPNFCLSQVPAAYVDIGYGARPMGMGGAYTALTHDAHSVLWNPAGLTRLKNTNATFMWTKQLNLIPYYFFAAGKPISKSLTLGTAVISSGNDVLRETTAFISIAYKRHSRAKSIFNNISYGLNFKLRNSTFGYNQDGGENQIQGHAYGFAMDFGVQWKISPRFMSGFMIRDIVSPVSYFNETLSDTYYEPVPTTMILGVAYLANKNFILTADWSRVLLEENVSKINAGMEYKIFRIFTLRAGFSQPLEADLNKKYNLGLGLFVVKNKKISLCFDFAYEIYFLANTPKVSTTIWF
ncbi:hypothetical protein H8E88_14520 [candidate division KSB1 bacterium]|nr:hypothetical protein [candidate division KSB1 bacterium]MBL7094951.1 hypothetical protein [candidate division KSB1 bacterium]